MGIHTIHRFTTYGEYSTVHGTRQSADTAMENAVLSASYLDIIVLSGPWDDNELFDDASIYNGSHPKIIQYVTVRQ
jgi:hypothetical protein